MCGGIPPLAIDRQSSMSVQSVYPNSLSEKSGQDQQSLKKQQDRSGNATAFSAHFYETLVRDIQRGKCDPKKLKPEERRLQEWEA